MVVANGYVGFTPTGYSPTVGYGWSDPSAVGWTDRGTPAPPERDFHWGRSDTFLADLPNGIYSVTLTLGDSKAAHAADSISLQGLQVATVGPTAAGVFITPTFQVTVSNGQLQLGLTALRATRRNQSPYFALDALDINVISVAPPVVGAGPAASGNEGSPVSFSGSVQGGIPPYTETWNFGDGTTASGTLSPSHTYTSDGNYTVSLTVTDVLGRSVTSTTTASIAEVPPTAAITGAPATGHSPEGTAITLGSNVTDPDPAGQAAGSTYSWTVTKNGSPFATGNAASITFTPDDAGTYVATLTATDNDGGASAPVSTTITADDVAPTVTITGAPVSAAPGAVISLGSAVTDPSSVDTAAGFTYSWTVTDNGAAFASGSGPNFSFTPTAAGTYVVSLAATDTDPETGTASQTIQVSPPPVASAGPGVTGNEGSAVSFSGSVQGGIPPYAETWNFGDGTTASGTLTPSHTYTSDGNYTVTLTVKDAAGISSTSTTTAAIAETPPAVAITGAPASADVGRAIALASTVTDPDPAGQAAGFAYAWTVTDNGAAFASGSGSSFSFTPNAAGTYVVTLAATDNDGGTGTTSRTITVNPPPVASAGPAENGNAGSPLAFAGSVQGGSAPETAAWNFGDGTTASGTLIPSHIYAAAGTYTVTLTVTDAAGVSSTSTTTASISGSTARAPAAPSNLAATADSPSEINLTWDLGDTTDTNVVIERETSTSGTFQTLAVLPGGENTFTDTSCWASTTYTYRVKARNAAGDSAYTAAQSATTQPVPSGALNVVSNLQAVADSPTSATISFTDTNTANAYRAYLLERSSDGVSYQTVASLETATSWTDVTLAPGTTYYYRALGASSSAPDSDYSPPVAVTLPGRPAGTPVEPSGLQATDLSATSVALAWVNNDPSDPQFQVERAAYDPYDPMTWTQVALTAPGVTSFTDTGLAPESPYVYRVRAVNAQGDSAYALPASDVMQTLAGRAVDVDTASAGTGSPKTYDIGPGEPYPTISSLDWSKLGPGDTVNIHYQPGGYHELFQISTRGTASGWITINGVPDPATGALPVIDGYQATKAPQFVNFYTPVDGSGDVVIGNRPGYAIGYKPGYILLQNLQFQDCYQGDNGGNTFTDYDGSTKAYGSVGAGIYLEMADHVTIKNDVVTNNGEGIFGAGQSSFARLMTDITLDGNSIYGNGNIGSSQEHNTYLEGINTVYQFNRYGPVRGGSAGAGLKDRSVGTVIRYNYIVGGGHQLDLVEAQNEADLAMTLPEYHQTFVYGNTLVAPEGNASDIVYYGGDASPYPFYRKGVLYLYNNTIVSQSDRATVYGITAVHLSTTGETLDARDNILTVIPSSGQTPAYFTLIGSANNAYFGRNWVPSGYYVSDFNAPFTGHAAGTGNLLVGTSQDPGFVNPVGGDYHLKSGSACIEAASRLAGAGDAFPVSEEYLDPQSGEAIPTADDLGAFEYGI
jgi:PKD repeat protein